MATGTPPYVEPKKEYLGVICHSCQRFVPVIGPLDPAKIPPEQPMTLGSRGPLHVECSHCKHSAEYPITEMRRERAS
jgi:hypothetical protein